MRKFILYLLMIISIGLSAQKYVPFPTENVQWNEFYASQQNYSPMDTTLLQYSLHGDSTLNGIAYRKLCLNIGTIDNPEYKTVGGLREQDKKIYYSGKGYSIYFGSPTWNREILLYDFSKHIGDTIWINSGNRYIITKIDSVKIGNEYRKRYNDQIIEGIGDVVDGLLIGVTPICNCLGDNNEWHFVCFSQNGQSVYKNPDYVDCNSTKKWTDYPNEVKNPIIQSSVTVLPNPIAELSIIKWDVLESNRYVTLVITDVLGKRIKTLNVSGKTEISISRNDFSKGLYFARLVSDKGNRTTVKIIVQ